MDILQATRAFALNEIEQYGLPTLINFELSEQKAIELADKLHADKTITLLGVYLMDCKLGQAFSEKRGAEHVQMSVEASEEFLKQFDLDEETKKKILNCVAAHHWKVPYESLEAEIVANADCYRFISPKGVLSYFTILGKRYIYPDFPACLDEAEKKLDEKHAILSLEICKQELEPYYQTFKEYIRLSR